MSIILDALRSKKNAQQDQQPHAFGTSDQQKGFTISKTALGIAGFGRLTWGLFIFFGLLVSYVGFQKIKKRLSSDTPIEQATSAALVTSPSPLLSTGALEKADQLMASSNYEQALDLYLKLLEKNPQDTTLNNNIGLAFMKKQDYGDAERYFKKALQLDPYCFTCFNNLGVLKTKTKQYKQAKEAFEKAISLNDQYADPLFNLAVLAEQNQSTEEAIILYKKFLSAYPNKDTDSYKKVKKHILELGDF